MAVICFIYMSTKILDPLLDSLDIKIYKNVSVILLVTILNVMSACLKHLYLETATTRSRDKTHNRFSY